MRKFDNYNAPEKYRPMKSWGFYWWSIVYSIPIIGFIILLINACDPSNLCRRSHARSYFCGLFIALILIAAAYFILKATGYLDMVVESIQQYIQQFAPAQ